MTNKISEKESETTMFDSLPLDDECLAFLKSNDYYKSLFFELYKTIYTSRKIDILEEQYVARGEAFFHVAGSGHESIAVLNHHLIAEDYLHCHYRDKALMLARGITPEMFFLSLFCKDASHSRGRQMSAHLSDFDHNILSLVGPVGNNALQAVGVAAEIKNNDQAPIVICSLGDGTSQQGEVLEAIAEAVRFELPVLFIVEDNRYSISTLTDKKTFYNHPDKVADRYYGLPIERIDGSNPVSCFQSFEKLVGDVRLSRKPAIALLEVERLTSHTNADDQSIYRDGVDIKKALTENDPIVILRVYLEAIGFTPEELQKVDVEIEQEIANIAKKAQFSNEPKTTFIAKAPLPKHLSSHASEYTGSKDSVKPLTMLKAINQVLDVRLEQDPRISLYGEDIEDPKGDVFGITKGLSTKFPGRVVNSPLSESTIVGTSIGRALAGGRPVAFLQFADFLPLAFNQIISELGSMYWRTDGSWQCPVIIMITCGGYRPGLGPFHAQSLEAIAVHTPGIDVVMPSTAGDAAGMLNAAFDSERPTLFFYPKSCLNLVDSDSTTSNDVQKQCVPVGKARIARSGNDITFVSYGNTVQKCLQAAKSLEPHATSEVIDLRWLSPWDQETVLNSVNKTGKLIITHEDNQSCGMGAEIAAVVAEKSAVSVQIRRVTRADTYVPCNFANQLEVLPSHKRLLETAVDMLDLDLKWIEPTKVIQEDLITIEAIGVGPSDETVIVVELDVVENQEVKKGQTIAVLEASKAVFDFEAPVSGKIQKIYVKEDDEIQVGTPLFDIHIKKEDMPAPKAITREEEREFIITRKESPVLAFQNNVDNKPKKVSIQGISCALPSREISNEDVIKTIPNRVADEIAQLTGIETRHWVAEDESVLSLAVKAASQVLDKNEVDIRDIDLIICSTGTPSEITPSLACQVLYALSGNDHQCQAYDISAACSGYLYGLQNAYLYLQKHPLSRVLLITSEVLSPHLDQEDFETGIIFSDAATATLINGDAHSAASSLYLNEPILSGNGETLDSLYVPTMNSGKSISMNGRRVFTQGLKKMIFMLNEACIHRDITLQDLDLVVPHQANQRMTEAIAKRLDISHKIGSNIRFHGNTSSSSIPLYLSENWEDIVKMKMIGLTAFGGGFTYGSAILESQSE